MNISLRTYRLIIPLLLPLAALYLLWRARKQPDYLKHWSERYATGHFQAKRPGSFRIWIHAVSVGETNATRPLVTAILKRWPECDILLTHMTPTGRDAGKKIVALAPERIQQCFLPYDAAYAVRKFYREVQPDVGIIMETEVWPMLLAVGRELQIPLMLANARLSEKSFNQAMKFPRLMTEAMGQFSVVCAQAPSDAKRLQAMGARDITITGSLKFDIQPPAQALAKARQWKPYFKRPVVLLASTRDGEEAPLIEAIRASGRTTDVCYLLVPRHPQRFAEVEELLKKSGLSFVKRSTLSEPGELGSETVVLGDSMGEMFFYCALADVTIMGGSFGPFGCQNVIEPASVGVPVIVGESTFNFSEVVHHGLEKGAIVQVQDAEKAIAAALDWLDHPQELQSRRARAEEFAKAYVGATDRTMQVLEQLCRKK